MLDPLIPAIFFAGTAHNAGAGTWTCKAGPVDGRVIDCGRGRNQADALMRLMTPQFPIDEELHSCSLAGNCD
jgi:hypothetical protein